MIILQFALWSLNRSPAITTILRVPRIVASLWRCILWFTTVFFFTTFIQNRREDALSRLSLSSVLHSLLFIFCFVWGKRSKSEHKPLAGAWELSTSLQRKWSYTQHDLREVEFFCFGSLVTFFFVHLEKCLFAARKCRACWRKSSKLLPGPEIF